MTSRKKKQAETKRAWPGRTRRNPWYGIGISLVSLALIIAVFFMMNRAQPQVTHIHLQCFFSLATYLVVFAFRRFEISAVAPFRYTFLIFAGIAGYVSFDEVPDNWSIAGAALIVGSGLYTLHREAMRRHLAIPAN